MATLAVPIASEEQFLSPHTVKVVCSASGHALYFSRASIPHGHSFSELSSLGTSHADATGVRPLRHVGLYAFRRNMLEEWRRLEPSVLEKCESLEQLRPLAAGWTIKVLEVGYAAPDVNVPSDIALVEAALREAAA
mmetsp:Transcript_54615/g.129222  ORF Transcript_54615/g.129222 Transcript_54615/m.129222 type:complete len:136 (-) Transcript_54615:209-616(-)